MMNMKRFEEILETRLHEIDGISLWRWPKIDHGAWDGPWTDWVGSHKAKYLEHVKKFDVVVQAGGNCGMYPRLFSQYFKWVYTFEPDPLNFYALNVNCQDDRIVKIQAALGDSHKMVTVNRLTMKNVGMHRVAEVPGATIPQLMIDDFDLPACDLIQLDIELYEIHALRGAVNTIKKFKPVIAVENNNPEIVEFLTDLGYEIASTSKMDTIFIPKVDANDEATFSTAD